MPPPQTSTTASDPLAARPGVHDGERHGDRKRLGAWATPPDLVDLVVDRTIDAAWLAGFDRPVRVLDPACGDGRFLRAAARRIIDLGGSVELTGVDLDPRAVEDARGALVGLRATLRCGDALALEWCDDAVDLVVGNPPFLSQLSVHTTRGGASRHGGGPYADAAAEFLALAVAVTAERGRVGLVLPQSILAARDAGAVRAEVERRTERLWSWWSPDRRFDADVVVCALGVERRPDPVSRLQGCTCSRRSAAEIAGDGGSGPHPVWTRVITRSLGVPDLPDLRTDGTLGDHATLNANFRDEYYALVPAVDDHPDGPPLVTSGLIDPGVCHWGDRPARFAKRTFRAPRVDVARLDDRMRRWADRKLVPKVLVATQTPVIEAVVDAGGGWLPGVPVTSVVADQGIDPWAIGAVLTSPVASTWAWHRAAGTGLSARTLRLGPAFLADLPWPAGSLGDAVAALRLGDIEDCGALVGAAYGVAPADGGTGSAMATWWLETVDRLTRPRGGAPDGPPHG